MMKYEEYKTSGVDWPGRMPRHWEIKRIKDLFSQISLNSSELPENGYIPLENIESFTGRLIRRTSNENGESAKLFNRGDILLNKLRPYLGKVFIPSFDGGVSGEVVVLRYNASLWKKNVYTRYFFYKFLSTNFIYKINSLSDGVKMPRTSPSKILRLEIGIPTFIEQESISRYLDEKTQAIDKKVKLLSQKIEYYKELRISLINDVVIKGLDKTVTLKESSMDWIGQIPEHWEVKRGKDMFIEKSVKGFPNQPLLAASQKQGVVLKTMLENRSMEAQKSFDKFKLVERDDFVISLRSFEGGIEISYYRGIISPAYTVFKVKNDLMSAYYKHLFKSSQFVCKLQTLITGIRDGQAIKFEEIQNVFFPIPEKDEQLAIAQYLDQKTTTIDKMTENISGQIDRLKELRKTLINDVVTGKIRVFEATENSVEV